MEWCGLVYFCAGSFAISRVLVVYFHLSFIGPVVYGVCDLYCAVFCLFWVLSVCESRLLPDLGRKVSKPLGVLWGYLQHCLNFQI